MNQDACHVHQEPTRTKKRIVKDAKAVKQENTNQTKKKMSACHAKEDFSKRQKDKVNATNVVKVVTVIQN